MGLCVSYQVPSLAQQKMMMGMVMVAAAVVVMTKSMAFNELEMKR